MVEERVPQFCTICGSKLVANAIVQGYDPYTGEPVSDSTLYCDNPSVTHKSRLIGYGTTTHTYHPSWVNENGVWSQLG